MLTVDSIKFHFTCTYGHVLIKVIITTTGSAHMIKVKDVTDTFDKIENNYTTHIKI